MRFIGTFCVYQCRYILEAILRIIARCRQQNLFEKVKYCRNNEAMDLSLYIREISSPKSASELTRGTNYH